MKLIAIDPGKTGGIAWEDTATIMPVTKVESKPAVTVLDLDNKGNKQYYKSGYKKGQVKRKIKSPAKFNTELNIIKIYDIFSDFTDLIIELPGTTVGNAARSSRTTHINFGKLLATAELAGLIIHTVAPHKWKKDLELPKDKLQTVELAEKLTGKSFRTPNGALLDGPADAYCIKHWYKKSLKELK